MELDKVDFFQEFSKWLNKQAIPLTVFDFIGKPLNENGRDVIGCFVKEFFQKFDYELEVTFFGNYLEAYVPLLVLNQYVITVSLAELELQFLDTESFNIKFQRFAEQIDDLYDLVVESLSSIERRITPSSRKLKMR